MSSTAAAGRGDTRRGPLQRATLLAIGLLYRALLLFVAVAVILVDLAFLLPQSRGATNRALDVVLLIVCGLFAAGILYPVARPRRLAGSQADYAPSPYPASRHVYPGDGHGYPPAAGYADDATRVQPVPSRLGTRPAAAGADTMTQPGAARADTMTQPGAARADTMTQPGPGARTQPGATARSHPDPEGTNPRRPVTDPPTEPLPIWRSADTTWN